jgi:sulfite exporter TauE/SafE
MLASNPLLGFRGRVVTYAAATTLLGLSAHDRPASFTAFALTPAGPALVALGLAALGLPPAWPVSVVASTIVTRMRARADAQVK